MYHLVAAIQYLEVSSELKAVQATSRLNKLLDRLFTNVEDKGKLSPHLSLVSQGN